MAADQYEASFWQKWRAQLRLVLQKPWLAAGWLKQSRALFQRFNRIYNHLCQQPRPVRRRLQRQLGATLAGAALALALANAPVQAADFTASDQPTLVTAINSANDETTNPGPDTITLTDNITLTTIIVTDTIGSTDLPLGLPTISSTVTIEGAGFTIARDSNITETFGILSVAPTSTLTLNDATISGGASLAGAILNLGGALTVNDSTLTGNFGFIGGAISSKYGTTTINRSTFSNNLAKYSGAISLLTTPGYDVSATIVDSTVTNNISMGGAGGILNNQPLTITNTVISQNMAKYGNGGGIVNGSQTLSGGTLTITGSSITGNQAVGTETDGGFGGAIYNHGGSITLSDSTISGNNSGFSGGGIFNYSSPCGLVAADALASRCRASQLDDTTAAGRWQRLNPASAGITASALPAALVDQLAGRGIDAAQVQAWQAAAARFIAPSAARAANAVGDSSITLINSTVSNNSAGNNTTTPRTDFDDGGGIVNISGVITLTNSTVSGNQALNNRSNFHGIGGGIYNAYSGTLTLNNSTVTGNRAGFGGGAIYNDASATMTLVRSIISGNTAPRCAEIYNYSDGTFTASSTVDAANLFGQRACTNAKAFTCDYGSFTPGASDITATKDGVRPTFLNRILNTTLADNGGPTLTHALVAGSPAFNTGGVSGLATDQRGTARPQGIADDIGAVEMPVATITIALDARPNLATNLGFQGNLGGFILDDPAVDDGDVYTNTRTFAVVPGVYTVRRNNPATWFTTNITCTPSSGAAINLPDRSATLTLAADEAITCTYTVDRAVRITARAFNDIVRNNASFGLRNANDPWLKDWAMSVATNPTNTVASGLTDSTTTAGLYQINFPNLPAGDYTVCTVLPDGTWTPTTPTALDPNFAKYCKEVTLTPGQHADVRFGAYQASVVASESFTPADELITDEDSIITLPYDPAEDETVTEDDGLLRTFLPLINR
ncbi:MAG: choice-of-anchor Q domain-containing protein [Caldilineaceae bacterium]